MPTRTLSHRQASFALAGLDPTMAALVEHHGPMRITRPPAAGDRYETLAESIAYQQLAGRAAATIWGRFRALFAPGPLDPEAVLAAPVEDLRAAGLSGAKAAAIVDLSRHVADGTLDLAGLGRRSDAEVHRQLTQVRGIGPWTADMFLIFTLGRLDIWPVGDLGVRAGYAAAYRLGRTPTSREVAPLGEPFRPYRSVAAWYCWRATEGGAMDDMPYQSVR